MHDRLKRAALAFIVLAPLGGAPALAHHSFARFDADRQVTLQGTVQ
ncbi:MAG: hypothetical protein JO228_08235, partial [Xanthobacteraceae bacterium]|nr:hypothetical protein [Xanthobacteraceae bacterium]